MAVVIDDVEFQAPKMKKFFLDLCKSRATERDDEDDDADDYRNYDNHVKAYIRHFPNLTHLAVNLMVFSAIAGSHPNLSKLQGLVVTRCVQLSVCTI